jgi:hypothetical protein
MKKLDEYKDRARECWELAEKLEGDDARHQLRELAICWQRLSESAAQSRANSRQFAP